LKSNRRQRLGDSLDSLMSVVWSRMVYLSCFAP
jgi:hypothetical protein